MAKIVKNVVYLNVTEAAKALGMSPQLFNLNVRHRFEEHMLKGYKNPFFKADDINNYKDSRIAMKSPLVIHGITKSFVQELKNRGIPCTVRNVGKPGVVPMTEDIAKIFRKPVGTPVVRRGRLQGPVGTPYRFVVNWYDTEYADSDLLKEMQEDDATDMPVRIREKYGIVITHHIELISSRMATSEECSILQMRHGPVLAVRRVNFTSDNTPVMITEFVAPANLLVYEYEYDSSHWTN